MGKAAGRLKEIEEKIKCIYGVDEPIKKSAIKVFLKKHKIKSIYHPMLFNAIYGKRMIFNLGLEDFKLIIDNAKKAKFYSCKILRYSSKSMGKLMKPKLNGMKNAILILNGNEETTLDELAYVWDHALKYLPKDGKTAFAYKIDDVKKLQLNLMAVG